MVTKNRDRYTQENFSSLNYLEIALSTQPNSWLRLLRRLSWNMYFVWTKSFWQCCCWLLLVLPACIFQCNGLAYLFIYSLIHFFCCDPPQRCTNRDIQHGGETEGKWWTEGAGGGGRGVLIKELHVWRTHKTRRTGGGVEGQQRRQVHHQRQKRTKGRGKNKK